MQNAHDYFPDCPEALIVGLARTGDRNAFAELVRRRQSWIRNLMRRCCNDATLADDLAQQVFLNAWRSIRSLKQPQAFAGWLKRLAVNVWLQYLRKNDALRHAEEIEDTDYAEDSAKGVDMDLDSALAELSPQVRLCVVLSYQAGMSHPEIAESMNLPLGTVKSHINRGTKRLKLLLSEYRNQIVRSNNNGG